ncbi:hypothetical protein protein [Bacillus cereus G9241]|nr:hypothetical protein protein [Bacillus cereus G9241]
MIFLYAWRHGDDSFFFFRSFFFSIIGVIVSISFPPYFNRILGSTNAYTISAKKLAIIVKQERNIVNAINTV